MRDPMRLIILMGRLTQIALSNHAPPFRRLHAYFGRKISQHIKAMKMRIHMPKWMLPTGAFIPKNRAGDLIRANICPPLLERSEERRVGKECRSVESAVHQKRKNTAS